MSDFPLFEKATDYQMLKASYKQTQLCSRKYRKEAIIYDMARERNLVELWRELRNETYLPKPLRAFTVYTPKVRLIHAPRIRDKVVQYAAHRVLWELYHPLYIKDSYASMEGKGTHEAVKVLQHYMRLCRWEHGGGWILKMDIKKFFYSIDHAVLKKLLRKKIKDKKFLRLLDILIDSSPESNKGLPLGCATSQDFANIYMNEIDQLCKRFLGIKWYVRYMDDIVAIFPTKEEAQHARDKIVSFAGERLHLEFNQKTKIFPLAQGVNAYGFKIFTTHTQVRESGKRAMKRRIRGMDRKVQAGDMSMKETQDAVNSWLGHARHSNSYRLAKKIFQKYPYIQVDHPDFSFGKIPKGKDEAPQK